MSAALIGGSFFVWALLFGIDTVTSALAGTSCFSTFLQFDLIREAQQDILFLTFTFPAPNSEWFGCAGNLATWNQWLFSGWANWVRLTLYGAVSVAFFGPLVVLLFSAVLARFRG